MVSHQGAATGVILMNAPDPPVELARGVSASAAAAVYARVGRVHVTDVLSRRCAERAYLSLASEIPWQLHFNDGERTYDLTPEQQASLPESNRASLQEAIHRKAARGFQYLFENFPISDLYPLQRQSEPYLMHVYEFLNSKEFLEYARQLTGVKTIALVDAQATRYRPGHFLTCHDDDVAGKRRVAAYVLSLTPEWHADWGGILNFIDADGHVAEGYVPRFNVLNVFRVPQKHAVSCVSPFAPAARFSISGWFREA
jgi:Rps23 Pro-64 3,4-dihydroxylase Tpa1-like proline 4-hydroxylase